MRKSQDIKFTASKSSGEVSGILTLPDNPKYIYVFAHGAGAGMKHPFMEKVSSYLTDESIGTLRYNFPYTEKKLKRPDPAPILMETVRSAIKIASEFADGIPLLAGGKSMGGRMTSMAASNNSLEGVKGIVFFGFPLHPPGKPSTERSEHLYEVKIPMLFLQGTRDTLADLDLLKPVIGKLNNASLHIIDGGDHSFNVLKSSGKTNEAIIKELVMEVAEWADKIFS